ncbi:MAG: hypothetical protein ABJO01_01345 [Parasphingorhabdus sp.]|uniref:hypothetical protein n=1 Tax=Parasphingorhabdus sp. TaxID=2709688 RepID=UPI003296F1D4
MMIFPTCQYSITSQLAGETRVNIKSILVVGLALAGLFSVPQAWAQQDPRTQFPQVSTMSPHGVDLQSGRFVKEGVDLTMGPLTVDHYVKMEEPSAQNGVIPPYVYATSLHGHSNHFESSAPGNGVNVYENIYIGKQKITFTVLSAGGFFPFDSSNTGWRMVTSGADWVLTNKSGDTYIFNTHPGISSFSRRLTSMTSANGHKLTYAYDSAAKLKSVTSNRGYAVVLQYSGNNVIVCGVNLTVSALPSSCSGSNYKVTYGRDSAGKLTSITAVDGSVVNLQYVTWQNFPYLSCVTLPISSTCAIQNTYTGVGQGGQNADQVSTQITATGDIWSYTHLPIENNPGDYVPGFGEIRRSYALMAPPGGTTSSPGATQATFGNGFVESIVSPDGTSTYEYSTQGAYAIAYSTTLTGPHYYSVYPSKITYPEGNSISFTRDWADNVTTRSENPKPGSSATSNVTTWTYPTANQWAGPSICNAPDVLCDKPTKVTDPRGYATDYTYSATHGGMLTKTEPAVNGIRPQTRYTYTARYARDVNGTALQPPIYVLTSEEYCKTTAASGSGCVGGAADEVVTTYDYGPTSGPNNLLLRGTVADSTGLALRTCYRYDQYGRKIAETQPKGTGSTCP